MNDKVSYLRDEYRQQAATIEATGKGSNKGGGGSEPPEGDKMEARVKQLEQASQEIKEKLIRVEMRLDSIESSMATKVDLAIIASKDDMNGFVRAAGKDIQDLAVSFQKSINDQTWKFIGVAAALAGLAFTAARFVH